MINSGAAPQDEGIQFAAPRESKRRAPGPAIFAECFRWVPGRSQAPPGLESYFFFDFLAFFAFFAFFAFLAIVSSQGLMDGNATREACSAEGQPRNILAV